MAKAKGLREAGDASPDAKDLRVFSDSEVPSGYACAVATQIDLPVIDEANDAGHGFTFPASIAACIAAMSCLSGPVWPTSCDPVFFWRQKAATMSTVPEDRKSTRLNSSH